MKEIFAVKQAKLFNKFKILIISVGIVAHSMSWTWEILKKPQPEQLGLFKNVSIVFASRSLNSPVSSFGHILLVFHNESRPEPSALSFEYAGNLRSSFFILRSVLWHAPGFFKLMPWNQKYWEYEREDRDIWFFPLKLTHEERKLLNQNIKKALTEFPPYSFWFKNCASYIFDILKKTMKNFHCSIFFYVLPIDVLRALKRCDKLGKGIFVQAKADVLRESANHLSSKEKSILQKLHPWDPVFMQKNHSLKLQKVFSRWIDYKIPRADSQDVREQLFQLKKNYHHTISIPTYSAELSGLQFARNGRLTLSRMQDYWSFSVSPAEMRFISALNDSFLADHLEVMTLSIALKSKKVFLSELKLFDMQANSSSRILKPPFVRDIYLGYKKYLLHQDQSLELYSARAGHGYSYNLTDKVKLSALLFLEFGITEDVVSITSKNRLSFVDNKHLFFGVGGAGRIVVYMLQSMRMKAEYRYTIGKNSKISSQGNMQFVFYDRSPFVGSIEYLFFHTVHDKHFYNSLGLSLSWLF